MKKISFIFTILLVLIFSSVISGCAEKKDYSNYKNEIGYQAYISDRDNGDITSFCGTYASFLCDEDALLYYNNNIREVDGFLITNYENGICINRVLHPGWWNWEVPEKLDGLPVVKIGCYLDENGLGAAFVESPIPKCVNLPKTIKYIDCTCLYYSGTHIYYSVDNDNPYYEVDDDGLYALENGNKVYAEDDYDR